MVTDKMLFVIALTLVAFLTGFGIATYNKQQASFPFVHVVSMAVNDPRVPYDSVRIIYWADTDQVDFYRYNFSDTLRYTVSSPCDFDHYEGGSLEIDSSMRIMFSHNGEHTISDALFISNQMRHCTIDGIKMTVEFPMTYEDEIDDYQYAEWMYWIIPHSDPTFDELILN